NRELAAQLEGEPVWQAKAVLLRSAPAVGPVTAATLLAEFPELGTLDRKKVAALADLAPMNNDSGHKRGKRRTSGGRGPLRSTLYMATLMATRYNPVLEALYQNLLRRGKEKKAALTACMRKFLTILNAMLRDNRPWQPQLAPT
ncbi:MAG TPA: transposase, partial [Xanthomonadales bacterium]|nr:transposase [Xanthomonadales bacterium]